MGLKNPTAVGTLTIDEVHTVTGLIAWHWSSISPTAGCNVQVSIATPLVRKRRTLQSPVNMRAAANAAKKIQTAKIATAQNLGSIISARIACTIPPA